MRDRSRRWWWHRWAAGSPSWNLISYNGDLGGVPIAVSEMPRDGGPLWPDDDDARTAQRIDQKLDDVFRFESFEMEPSSFLPMTGARWMKVGTSQPNDS